MLAPSPAPFVPPLWRGSLPPPGAPGSPSPLPLLPLTPLQVSLWFPWKLERPRSQGSHKYTVTPFGTRRQCESEKIAYKCLSCHAAVELLWMGGQRGSAFCFQLQSRFARLSPNPALMEHTHSHTHAYVHTDTHIYTQILTQTYNHIHQPHLHQYSWAQSTKKTKPPIR